MPLSNKYILIVLTLLVCLSCQPEFKKETGVQVASVHPAIEYWETLLKDPATGKVPENAQETDKVFLESFVLAQDGVFSNELSNTHKWTNIGPSNIGGHTNAIVPDVTNPDLLIAGAETGGIWKSTNNGQTWHLKTLENASFRINSIAQDTRAGHQNIFYAAAQGIYKSTDSGDNWSLASDQDTKQYLEILVDPNNGNIYASTETHDLYRSTNGGSQFDLIAGNETISSGGKISFAITANGDLLLYTSNVNAGGPKDLERGVYQSTDAGTTWQLLFDSTQLNFTDINKAIIESPKSNPNVAYVCLSDGSSDSHTLVKLNLQTQQVTNLSANLPSDFESYNGYCLIFKIKPDDENVMLLGGIQLYRSTDGFTDKSEIISNSIHVDQQSFSFHPTDPKKSWIGNDGGVFYTEDITKPTEFIPDGNGGTGGELKQVEWVSKNNSYLTTQLYAVSIKNNAKDTKVIGGFQDNGSELFKKSDKNYTNSTVGNGDGGYSYIGDKFIYVSLQYGVITRHPINGDVVDINTAQDLTPPGSNHSFINPFAVDPNNENVMYFIGNKFLRHNSITTGNSDNWKHISNLDLSGITALEISKKPAHILYYAGADEQGNPKIRRLTNSTTATSAQDISTNLLPQGAYVSSIAVNPNNADEVLITASNRNIKGLIYSSNGGQSFQHVEGNLEGTAANPGPAILSVNILPHNESKIYFAGTTIGLFYTSKLEGDQTQWQLVRPDLFGISNVTMIKSRSTDGFVAISTYGRGVIIGEFDKTPEIINPNKSNTIRISPNPSKDVIKINLKNKLVDDVALKVIALSGAILMEQEKFNTSEEFNIGNLQNGLYFLQIKHNNETWVCKFIKK